MEDDGAEDWAEMKWKMMEQKAGENEVEDDGAEG